MDIWLNRVCNYIIISILAIDFPSWILLLSNNNSCIYIHAFKQFKYVADEFSKRKQS